MNMAQLGIFYEVTKTPWDNVCLKCHRGNSGHALADHSADILSLIDLSTMKVAPIDQLEPDSPEYLYVEPAELFAAIFSFPEYLT